MPANLGNTVYVVVQNQVFKPVAGAKVHVVLSFQGGTLEYPMPDTNADGISSLTLPGIDLTPKQLVQLQVTVDYQNKSETAGSWYRIWY